MKRGKGIARRSQTISLFGADLIRATQSVLAQGVPKLVSYLWRQTDYHGGPVDDGSYQTDLNIFNAETDGERLPRPTPSSAHLLMNRHKVIIGSLAVAEDRSPATAVSV